MFGLDHLKFLLPLKFYNFFSGPLILPCPCIASLLIQHIFLEHLPTSFQNCMVQIIADGNCSHEIKRCLLLGRKAMTNPDSALKSRDITWPTKICVVKAMVFPVVMYRERVGP